MYKKNILHDFSSVKWLKNLNQTLLRIENLIRIYSKFTYCTCTQVRL